MSRTLKHGVLVVALLASFDGVRSAHAQNIPQLRLPPVQLTFGLGINPFQVQGINAPLSSRALLVQNEHNTARQQTLLALQYITVNRRNIQAGNDSLYNQTFGAYYDRNNPFASTYQPDTSHYQRVLETYTNMHRGLESPTNYDFGGGVSLVAAANSTNVFGFNFGERHWGFSNSASAANLADGILGGLFDFNNNQITTLIPNRSATAGAVFWHNDNALGSRAIVNPPQNATPNQILAAQLQTFANFQDFAFFTDRMDIYAAPNSPNQQFLGETFFRLTGRYGGELEQTLAESGLPFGAAGGFLFQFFNVGWNGDPQLLDNQINAAAFSDSPINRWQMIMASFSEYTTNLNDPRAGAFWGVRGLINAFDRIAQTNGSLAGVGAAGLYFNAMDAENFARFAALLNANGITDPRQFPPRGKNGQQFNPLLPAPNFIPPGGFFLGAGT